MSDKDAFVSSLFQPKRPAPTGPLVEDLDAPTTFPNSTCDAKVAPPIPPVEEKSMLELMMEEQKAAKREKEKLQEKERAKMSKDIGSGFKKGFFGGGSKPTKKPPSASAAPAAATKPATKSAKADEIVTLSKPKANANIVNNGAAGDKKDTSGLVMEDVQEAMRADENPVLQDLKKGEWMNDNLTARMQANPVIRKGMMNPKCVAAMQLFQTDPKQAQAKFAGDVEAEVFMREFSLVMSDHFMELGRQQDAQKQSQGQGQSQSQSVVSKVAAPLIQPVGSSSKTAKATTGNSNSTSTGGGSSTSMGPLHEQAMRNSHMHGTMTQTPESKVAEDKKVEKILQSDELREMLLDSKLQAILQECNDPMKFQRHMQDPVTARKIKLLFDNGLVGTAK